METQEAVKNFEGIFEVEHPKDDYASIKTKFAKAKILDIQQKTKNIYSTAIFTSNEKSIDGALLTLENLLGKEDVYFPGITSRADYKNLKDCEVEYFEKEWSSTTEGTSVDYTLNVLSGPLKGQVVKGNTFA